MKKYIPLCETSDPAVADLWETICLEHQATHDKWVALMRNKGVVVAHPDDGWVDREKNTVEFMCPHFGEKNVRVGALVAIGNDRKWRLVTITQKITGMLGGLKWEFTPAWGV